MTSTLNDDEVRAPFRIIDADTHVTEPVDLWTSRLSKKWGDRVPHVAYNADWDRDCWIVGNRVLHPVGFYNWAGWNQHLPSFPGTLEESNPAGWDPKARLAMMDEHGIHAQVLFPNTIGFEPQAFLGLGDPELTLDCVRAYNDFQTEFASASRDRLVPISVLPFWDVDACVAEMLRCHEMGHTGALWAAKLEKLGYQRINSHHWDPVYAAAQDLEMSLSLHIGIGAFTNADLEFRKGYRDNFKVTAYIVGSVGGIASNMESIATLVVSDVFDRFPRLQIVSVESGFGYLPYLLEALDWEWKNSSGPLQHASRRLPSEKFLTNMWATFWFERDSLAILNYRPELGDRLMFETDFPHPGCLYPGPASASESPSVMAARVEGLPDDIIRKIFYDNAAKLFKLG